MLSLLTVRLENEEISTFDLAKHENKSSLSEPINCESFSQAPSVHTVNIYKRQASPDMLELGDVEDIILSDTTDSDDEASFLLHPGYIPFSRIISEGRYEDLEKLMNSQQQSSLKTHRRRERRKKAKLLTSAKIVESERHD